MSLRRSYMISLAIIGATLLLGCADETSQLKQKIAELEKRIQKQEKDLKEFSGKFSLPRDFSADIQRIEDQQDRISEAIKTKVDPVNVKLEEFRDWAQEAQKEREDVKKKLKTFEDAVAEMEKRVADGIGQAHRLAKAYAADKKALAAQPKGGDVTKTVEQLRKEMADSNAKVVEAVKKTLPKIKDAAVAELKAQITPMEKELAAVKTELENDRKALAAIKTQGVADEAKVVQSVNRRLKELEDVLTTHKSFLLDVGAKVHELEQSLRRGAASDSYSGPGYSRR